MTKVQSQHSADGLLCQFSGRIFLAVRAPASIEFAYESATWAVPRIFGSTATDYHFNSPDHYTMDQSQITESKKRSLTYIQAQEIAYKLKSKADLIQYMDKHRKCPALPLLTP